MKNKNALIFLSARDFNETEYKTVRAALLKEGISIFILSDSSGACVGENGLKVQPDVRLMNARSSNYSALILIGGKGIKAYWTNLLLHKIAAEFSRQKKTLAAICGAPVILAKAGILKGAQAVCFKEHIDELKMEGASVQEAPVVVFGNIITASDDFYASPFAEIIIRALRTV